MTTEEINLISFPAANSAEDINTATLASDLNLIYTDIMAIPATSSMNPLIFGSGETLSAGIYDIAGAASIAGTLTLDLVGDPNALFVISATRSFNRGGSGVNVTLVNGTTAKNVFWVADRAIGIDASTTIQRTLCSHESAVAVGTCRITGRLLGAISFGAVALSLPMDSSNIDFRSLSRSC